jgi:hypothetical protein
LAVINLIELFVELTTIVTHKNHYTNGKLTIIRPHFTVPVDNEGELDSETDMSSSDEETDSLEDSFSSSSIVTTSFL